MTDYMRELAKKQTTAWNRNRWLLLDLGKDIDERDIVGHKITGVTGILTDVTNPTIQLTAAPVSGDEITTSTNHYILANFNEAYQNGTGTVTAGSESHNFYLRHPHPLRNRHHPLGTMERQHQNLHHPHRRPQQRLQPRRHPHCR